MKVTYHSRKCYVCNVLVVVWEFSDSLLGRSWKSDQRTFFGGVGKIVVVYQKVRWVEKLPQTPKLPLIGHRQNIGIFYGNACTAGGDLGGLASPDAPGC
jgi:hypothetical protein